MVLGQKSPTSHFKNQGYTAISP